MRVSRVLFTLLLVTSLALATGAKAALARHPSRHAARQDAALAAEAKITMEAAKATALTKVPFSRSTCC